MRLPEGCLGVCSTVASETLITSLCGSSSFLNSFALFFTFCSLGTILRFSQLFPYISSSKCVLNLHSSRGAKEWIFQQLHLIDMTVSISFYLLVTWFHSIPRSPPSHSLFFCYPEFQQDCGQTPSFLSLGLKRCQSLLRLRGEH